MPPRESQQIRPPQDRQPYARRRMSVDGIVPLARRPVAPVPMSLGRPLTSAPRPPSAPIQASAPVRTFSEFTAAAPVQRPNPIAAAPKPAPALAQIPDPEPIAVAPVQPNPPLALPAAEPEALLEPVNPPDPEPLDKPVIKKLDFTPPPKAKKEHTFLKKLVLPRSKVIPEDKIFLKWFTISVFAIAAISAGVFYGHQWLGSRGDVNDIFKQAISASLSTTSVQAVTTNNSGTLAEVNMDLSSVKNPTVSSKQAVSMYGTNYTLAGWGNANNSYISYVGFPSAEPTSIMSVVNNAWIQLRANGTQPTTVNAALSNVADPRYQAFGPVVFANIPATIRQRLAQYAITQGIYTYDAKQVSRTSFSGQKVLAYPVSVNAGYLKIYAESAATSEGFTPTDLAQAVANYDNIKQATIYVSSDKHQIVGFSYPSGNQTITIGYSNFGSATVADEPQTRVTWDGFAAVQDQIAIQAAEHASAATLDAERKANLTAIKQYLTTYETQFNVYPTFANLADPNWVAANLPGFDPDLLRDPLAKSTVLSSVFKAGTTMYAPLSASGQACDNAVTATPQLCTSFTLGSVLSNQSQFTVKSSQ